MSSWISLDFFIHPSNWRISSSKKLGKQIAKKLHKIEHVPLYSWYYWWIFIQFGMSCCWRMSNNFEMKLNWTPFVEHTKPGGGSSFFQKQDLFRRLENFREFAEALARETREKRGRGCPRKLGSMVRINSYNLQKKTMVSIGVITHLPTFDPNFRGHASGRWILRAFVGDLFILGWFSAMVQETWSTWEW